MWLRLTQLYTGLAAYGVSMALMFRSGLGLQPWDVLHEGIVKSTDVSFGLAIVLTGAVTLLLWIPLRERPGIGTVSNVLLVGVVAQASLTVLPDVHGVLSWVALGVGVGLNGLATAAYIAARFGAGPRDGLTLGLARRTGRSVRLVRATIELVVVAAGFALGGTVGVGTLFHAFLIGPLVQGMLPWFDRRSGLAGGLAPVVLPGRSR